MSIQKCSGLNCVKKKECLRFMESKSNRKTRGKWINADICIQLMFSELLIKKDEK